MLHLLILSQWRRKKKSIVIDGVPVNFEKRLNLKGVEQTDARYLSFDVEGPCEITIAYCGPTSATVNRVLNISYGDTHDMKNLLGMTVPVLGALTTSTVKYELDGATTIHVGSGNSGAYIYGIYVKSIEPSISYPQTPKLLWNFEQAISDMDVANMTADTENWGVMKLIINIIHIVRWMILRKIYMVLLFMRTEKK